MVLYIVCVCVCVCVKVRSHTLSNAFVLFIRVEVRYCLDCNAVALHMLALDSLGCTDLRARLRVIGLCKCRIDVIPWTYHS